MKIEIYEPYLEVLHFLFCSENLFTEQVQWRLDIAYQNL